MSEPVLSELVVASAAFDELSVRILHDILKLRCEIFVVEQDCAYADIDGRDAEPGVLHFWISDDAGTVVAALRLLDEPDGAARIGRVVTSPVHRSGGLAARLVRAAVDRAGGRVVRLGAQSQLRDWYARFGFVVDGEEFLEDGIAHTPMVRTSVAGS